MSAQRQWLTGPVIMTLQLMKKQLWTDQLAVSEQDICSGK
jgi:hypothetical protein